MVLVLISHNIDGIKLQNITWINDACNKSFIDDIILKHFQLFINRKCVV